MILNPFPSLLGLSFFAPTLLRTVAAFTFFFIIRYQYHHRGKFSHTRFPVVGSGAWIVWAVLIVEAATGLGLLLGFYTQIAALLGIITALKGIVWQRRFPVLTPLGRVSNVLVGALCLSLLVTGAGAFAIDVPL